MTRVNLVPVHELTDQHLFAEFREIKMVPKALARSLEASKLRGEITEEFLRRIPKEFTLNTGHVTFFYDKYNFLSRRFYQITAELRERGVDYDRSSQLDEGNVYAPLSAVFFKEYAPTPQAIAISRLRIAEKIAMKPGWYLWYGKHLDKAEGFRRELFLGGRHA